MGRMSVTLRVRCIDEAGNPVFGAAVRHGDEVPDVVTDADGIAIVDGIETGFAMVTVSHTMPAEAQLTFSLGEGSSGIVERTVTLRRGALLCGTVVTPEGTPLPGASVAVWCGPGRMLFLESDARGNWNVPAMQAGAYEVRAGADGYARGPVVCGIHDGRTEQRDVVVRVAIGARLFGRVCAVDGTPVAGANVYTEVMAADTRSTTTDIDGRYEIVGLGPGRRTVSIARQSSSLVLGGDGEDHELDVVLPDVKPTRPSTTTAPCATPPRASPSTAAVSGRVLRDGAPVSRFAIVRTGQAAYEWMTGPAIIHAPDGRFTLAELREDTFNVHVLALGCAWTSIEDVTPTPGETHDLGDIVLSPGRQIVGTVRNLAGDPIGGATVAIGTPLHGDPLLDATDVTFATTSEPDGTFVLDFVQRRELRVRIHASHVAHGASLHHLPSDTHELVLVPTGAIDGVIDSHGSLHAGVSVRGDAPERGNHSADVRPSGLFTVENLLPGDYTLELFQRPGWPPRTARATVIAGQRTQVRMPPP